MAEHLYSAQRAALEARVREAKDEIRNFLDMPAMHALRNLAIVDSSRETPLDKLHKRYGITKNEPTPAGRDRMRQQLDILLAALKGCEDALTDYLKVSVGCYLDAVYPED